MTDPDYAAREEFLGSMSPKPLTKLQEERARALHKLAAYKKSAEILNMIKQRIGSDEKLKGYLVKELSKSGSDIGSFVASELKTER